MSNETEKYTVLINDEMQYSTWSVKFSPPAGWRKIDIEGPLELCNAYINEHWTDMRPKSLQESMSRAQPRHHA